jgi:hypothetical protein
MRIQKVDEAISACEQHLRVTDSEGTQIEALLTRSLLVLTCSAFEEQIERIIDARTQSLGDVPMQVFFQSCVGAVFRSTKSNEIAGLLGRFGSQFKESFNRKAAADPVAVTFYNNIVTNRHGVAHTQGLNCTLNDLRSFYDRGHVVLDYLRDTMQETITVEIIAPQQPAGADGVGAATQP